MSEENKFDAEKTKEMFGKAVGLVLRGQGKMYKQALQEGVPLPVYMAVQLAAAEQDARYMKKAQENSGNESGNRIYELSLDIARDVLSMEKHDGQ